MDTSDETEKTGNDIEKLVRITSDIQDLYLKKLQQLDDLKNEVSDLKDVLNSLKSMVSIHSFKGADEIYSKSISRCEDGSDNYFQETVHPDKIGGGKLKRKIFAPDSKKGEKLIAILTFVGMKEITVKFLYPEESSIRETSESFIRVFIKEALVKVKEKNPDLNVTYEYLKKSDLISLIKILNVSTIDDFDLITSKIQDLLIK
ncbi:MAG: hypothetical protein JW891_06105 [Candidatus Lokiarchaeota archaeon]|nr:hypothetical protein [Candidatus Lokiarchaeota archaeon]